MEEKKFVIPETEIISFDAQDVITASDPYVPKEDETPLGG